jgi:hypothetical protein
MVLLSNLPNRSNDRCHLPIAKPSFTTHKATNLRGVEACEWGSNLLTLESGGFQGVRTSFRTYTGSEPKGCPSSKNQFHLCLLPNARLIRGRA